MNCPKCGYKNEENADYYGNCGSILNLQNSNISHDMVAFIGKNAYYYVRKFSNIIIKNKIISWNWGAYFFGPIWLFYRKLYFSGIVLFIAQYLGEWYVRKPLYGFLNILTGLFGNYFYMKYAEKEIKKFQIMPSIEKHAQYLHKGGANIVAAIILGIVSFVLTFYIEVIRMW